MPPLSELTLEEIKLSSSFLDAPSGRVLQFGNAGKPHVCMKASHSGPSGSTKLLLLMLDEPDSGIFIDPSDVSGPFFDVSAISELYIKDPGPIDSRLFAAPVSRCLYKSTKFVDTFFIYAKFQQRDFGRTEHSWVCIATKQLNTTAGFSYQTISTAELCPVGGEVYVRRRANALSRLI